MRIVLLALKVLGGAVLVLAATVGVLYATNTTAPLAPISLAEAETSAKPYVIRMHAQWCYYCRGTKGAWEEIVEAYSDRVNLVALDFTDEETWLASEAE